MGVVSSIKFFWSNMANPAIAVAPETAEKTMLKLGVGGGHLVVVESTGYLIKHPFYVLVRVRVRARCNGH